MLCTRRTSDNLSTAVSIVLGSAYLRDDGHATRTRPAGQPLPPEVGQRVDLTVGLRSLFVGGHQHDVRSRVPLGGRTHSTNDAGCADGCSIRSQIERARPDPPPGNAVGIGPGDTRRVTDTHVLDARFDDSLLIEPQLGWVSNYAVTALLAGFIAALGMRLDSAPVVIGAMLVAPVMRPVLGMAFALLSDVSARVYVRLAAVLAATVVALVALGFLIAKLMPSTQVLLADEVLARTAPDVRDLFVALAAGAVGAFAILRPKVSETIPGVAIAVALVPPLVAAGIAFAESFPSQATGALLLFATNLIAIIAGATITTLALERTGTTTPTIDVRRLAVSSAIVISISVALGAALTGAFASAVAEARDDRDRTSDQSLAEQQEEEIRLITEDWLADSDQPTLSLVSIELPLRDGVPTVDVVLIGPEDSYVPPLVYGDRGELVSVEEQIQELLGPETAVRVRVTAVSDQLDSRFDEETAITADQRAQLRRDARSVGQRWFDDVGTDAEVLDVRVDEDGEVLVWVASATPFDVEQLRAALSPVLRNNAGVRFVVEAIQ